MTRELIQAHQFSNSELTQFWKDILPDCPKEGFMTLSLSLSTIIFSAFFWSGSCQIYRRRKQTEFGSAGDNMSTCGHNDAHREYVTKIRIT